MEQTVAKALSLLEALIEAHQPQRLTDLAVGLGMTKPNVHRLLATLMELGYVQQDAVTSLYSPTMKVVALSSHLTDRADLVAVAEPTLKRLAQDSHESTLLAVFDQGYSVYVSTVDSARPIRAVGAVGTRVPASCISTGKALLAWLVPEALDATLPLLQKFTPRTVTGRAAIERQLALVRRQGYAINRGEWRLGIGGIASPVRDAYGVVIAAVGLWGDEQQLFGPRRAGLIAQVTEAGAEISRAMGYRLPSIPAQRAPSGAPRPAALRHTGPAVQRSR